MFREHIGLQNTYQIFIDPGPKRDSRYEKFHVTDTTNLQKFLTKKNTSVSKRDAQFETCSRLIILSVVRYTVRGQL
jgi:hypothetical protein